MLVLPAADGCDFRLERVAQTAGARGQCERLLTVQLGLTAKLAAVSYPQPGVRLYGGLELADPETDRPVFACRFLEVSRVDGRLVVHASAPVLEAARGRQVWELLVRRLRHELASREEIELLPCELTLRSELGEQTYELLGGRIEPGAGGESAELRFRLPGAEMHEPASIRIVRNQQRQTPSTKFELSTAGGAPLFAVRSLGRCGRALGDRATFTGSLWADDASDGWEAELAGRFEEIDLDALVSRRFDHVLQGAGHARIDGRPFRPQPTCRSPRPPNGRAGSRQRNAGAVGRRGARLSFSA